MIRCLAVDDEAYAVKMIADYIAKTPYLELAGTTTSAIEALSLIQKGGIDLVFLDIQMPELTGIQFLRLCGSKCKVILTTAYSEYAIEGFEHDVVDYLLKPIAFDRFLKAAQKAYDLLNPQIVANHAAVSAPAEPAAYMFVKGDNKNKFLKVAYDDILYIEGLKNYVSIFMPHGRLVTYQTLRELDEQLPKPPFYRVHKSYIVSLNKIRLVEGNTIYVGDVSIPLGDTYREIFFEVIKSKPR